MMGARRHWLRRGGVVLAASLVTGTLILTAIAVGDAATPPPRPPSPPVLVSEQSGPTPGYVFLRWNLPADHGSSPIISYSVAISTDAGTTWSAPVSLHSITRTAASSIFPAIACPNLAPGSAGCRYRVSAQNAAGLGPPSNVLVAWVAPSSPATLSGAATNGAMTAVALHWPAPKTTGGLSITYDVTASTDGGPYALATTTGLRTAVVACSGRVTCGYLVRAKNIQGVSTASPKLTVTTAPGSVSSAIVTVTHVDLAKGVVTTRFSFGAPTSGLPPVKYEFQQCAIPAGARSGCESTSSSWGALISLAPPAAGSTSKTRSCSAGIATCAFRVRGRNDRNGAGVWRTLNVEPWAPYEVRVTRTSHDRVTVTFNGPAESGAGATGAKRYRVFTCPRNCTVAASWSNPVQLPYPPQGNAPFSAAAVPCVRRGTKCFVRMQFIDGLGRQGPLTSIAGA